MKIRHIWKYETYWVLIFDDGGGRIVRHSLPTCSGSELTFDELVIDALCRHVMELKATEIEHPQL